MNLIGSYTQRCYRALMLDELEEYEDIIAGLTAVIGQAPTCVAALNNRGLAYAETGRDDEAEADFAEAACLSRSDAAPLANWGDLLRHRGDMDGAVVKYVEASAIEPQNAYMQRCAAHALAGAGRHAEAIVYFTQAIACDDQFARTFDDRAQSYAALGDMANATADRARSKALTDSAP